MSVQQKTEKSMQHQAVKNTRVKRLPELQ